VGCKIACLKCADIDVNQEQNATLDHGADRSGSLAIFGAILRASSHVSSLAADRRPGPPMRVVAGLPGLYQVIDGVHRAIALRPQGTGMKWPCYFTAI